MRALARVGVLVKMRAVEVGKGETVAREVGRYPVHDDADVFLVEVVDQVGEVLGRAEALGRGEEAGDLIAPGAVEGVL